MAAEKPYSSSIWPDSSEMERVKEKVKDMAGVKIDTVHIVVSPYRICPLGAHIDHQGKMPFYISTHHPRGNNKQVATGQRQNPSGPPGLSAGQLMSSIVMQGGSVTAMAIDKGVMLAFAPSLSRKIMLHSGQFKGTVQFSLDKIPPSRLGSSLPSLAELDGYSTHEECRWGDYARGAATALQKKGYHVSKGMFGYLEGSRGFDGGGVSSSAAVGVAFLLALEHVNDLHISEEENIELHSLIENDYLGLHIGILDQSAVLLSRQHCLSLIHCNDRTYEIVVPPWHQDHIPSQEEGGNYKILIAFSGLRHALAHSPGYNMRVNECYNAAEKLLRSVGRQSSEPLLCNVTPEEYMEHKSILQGALARRAEHFFTENARVQAGVDAWASGDLVKFGKLMTDSGQSSIENYECGCDPLVQLRQILLQAPGVSGARFSGAGFRGCCVAFVAGDQADRAAEYVQRMYKLAQPELVKNIVHTPVAIICNSGERAHLV